MKGSTTRLLGRGSAAAALAFAIIAAGSLLAKAGPGLAAGSATPTESSPPTISGTPQDNETLKADPGKWNGSGSLEYSYQWLRCNADGGSCSALGGKTSQTYEVTSHDVGHTLRVEVTVSNNDGSASDTSVPTAVAKAATSRPSEASPPTITGTPQDNRTLIASPGKWNGSAPITFSYQWRRCDGNGGNCGDIGGQTNQWYTVTSHDVGATFRVKVTARNDGGSASDTSVPTARASAAPPTQPPTGCPGGSGPVNVSQLSAPARLTVDAFQSSPPTLRRDTTDVTLRFHVTACGGRAVAGALVYATAIPYAQFTPPPEGQTAADGWVSEVLHRAAYYPVSQRQQLLAVFVRARKPGEDLLGGISTRRLITFRVDLRH
jgi:hypothetical protein